LRVLGSRKVEKAAVDGCVAEFDAAGVVDGEVVEEKASETVIN
jgi:hypothetical protein